MEGTLTEEIWQKVAEDTGIEDFAKTTRDVPSYSDLMDARLAVMEKEGITLKDIQIASSKVDLLDGARDFLESLRQNFQVVILSDTFHEIASPLMEKLSFPLLLCHTLTVNNGMITAYKLRQEKAKQEAIKAFKRLGYRCFAAGDSFNDIQMFEVCKKGFFINAPEKVTSMHPEVEIVKDYTELEAKLLENSIYQYE
tara:strand:- start:838 stop:1428 length:591 start_codon:yes stop_codon:yes gene_type:complete